jgi:hypothetical protein
VANIRARTWTVNTPQFCVFNTNDGSSAPTYGYNGRNTFAVYGDGRVWIRSLETYVPMLSIGQYTSTSSSETNGVGKFRVYSDARTEWVASSGTQNMLTVKDASNVAVFRVRGDGKTYIGSKIIKQANAHNDAILQVAGKIGCMELVILDPITKWADYVFENDYALPTIKEVEQYILTHKHLPEVPAEQEVREKGLNVWEMNLVLLKKVEEQMLYIIQLNKKVENLEKEIKAIKDEKK